MVYDYVYKMYFAYVTLCPQVKRRFRIKNAAQRTYQVNTNTTRYSIIAQAVLTFPDRRTSTSTYEYEYRRNATSQGWSPQAAYVHVI